MEVDITLPEKKHIASPWLSIFDLYNTDSRGIGHSELCQGLSVYGSGAICLSLKLPIFAGANYIYRINNKLYMQWQY